MEPQGGSIPTTLTFAVAPINAHPLVRLMLEPVLGLGAVKVEQLCILMLLELLLLFTLFAHEEVFADV